MRLLFISWSVLLCQASAISTFAGATNAAGAMCPEHSALQHSTCICDAGYTCYANQPGDHCLLTRQSVNQSVTMAAFRPECGKLGTCRCIPNDTAESRRLLAGNGQQNTSTLTNRRRLLQTHEATAKPFAYLKLHKVGSTTVAIALERMADKHDLRLCSRPLDTHPCKAWTTHGTEHAMREAGVKGLRSAVGGDNAIALTILRDPVQRLLSRYFYDIALSGKTVKHPPSYNEFITYLDQHEAEQAHYMRDFARKTNAVEDAKQAIEDFDVVGVSEDLDGFMALLSYHLNVPPAHLTYKNEKVVLGRPQLKDLEPRLQTHLKLATANDFEVYLAAQRRFEVLKSQVPDFKQRLSEFKAAQAKVDQSCKFAKTVSEVLRGRDCYKLA
eukprot:m.235715 g.235715  ORF g.235715 m.235715 type:complete len:385 (-) comp17409_c0_seq2:83-1237(-)